MWGARSGGGCPHTAGARRKTGCPRWAFFGRRSTRERRNRQARGADLGIRWVNPARLSGGSGDAGARRGRYNASDSAQAQRGGGRTYVLPEDFPQRLKLFQEESGLSWSEIARRLETYRHTVWRWAEGRTRPNYQHRKALVELWSPNALHRPHVQRWPHTRQEPPRRWR